jgi:hypothetical protein
VVSTQSTTRYKGGVFFFFFFFVKTLLIKKKSAKKDRSMKQRPKLMCGSYCPSSLVLSLVSLSTRRASDIFVSITILPPKPRLGDHASVTG